MERSKEEIRDIVISIEKHLEVLNRDIMTRKLIRELRPSLSTFRYKMISHQTKMSHIYSKLLELGYSFEAKGIKHNNCLVRAPLEHEYIISKDLIKPQYDHIKRALEHRYANTKSTLDEVLSKADKLRVIGMMSHSAIIDLLVSNHYEPVGFYRDELTWLQECIMDAHRDTLERKEFPANKRHLAGEKLKKLAEDVASLKHGLDDYLSSIDSNNVVLDHNGVIGKLWGDRESIQQKILDEYEVFDRWISDNQKAFDVAINIDDIRECLAIDERLINYGNRAEVESLQCQLLRLRKSIMSLLKKDYFSSSFEAIQYRVQLAVEEGRPGPNGIPQHVWSPIRLLDKIQKYAYHLSAVDGKLKELGDLKDLYKWTERALRAAVGLEVAKEGRSDRMMSIASALDSLIPSSLESATAEADKERIDNFEESWKMVIDLADEASRMADMIQDSSSTRVPVLGEDQARLVSETAGKPESASAIEAMIVEFYKFETEVVAAKAKWESELRRVCAEVQGLLLQVASEEVRWSLNGELSRLRGEVGDIGAQLDCVLGELGAEGSFRSILAEMTGECNYSIDGLASFLAGCRGNFGDVCLGISESEIFGAGCEELKEQIRKAIGEQSTGLEHSGECSEPLGRGAKGLIAAGAGALVLVAGRCISRRLSLQALDVSWAGTRRACRATSRRSTAGTIATM